MSHALFPTATASATIPFTSIQQRRHPPSSLDSKQANLLLSQCTTARRLSEIHAAVVRSDIHHHDVVNFRLQKLYASFGYLDKLLILFRQTPDPSVFFWTNAIHAHACQGIRFTALLLFIQMLSSNAIPNGLF
jgi:hypothetical protein